MARPLKFTVLRDAIATALSSNAKSYELPEVCQRYGLEIGDLEEAKSTAFRSKFVYVKTLTTALSLAQLVDLAHKVIEDYDDADLERLLEQSGSQGVTGEFKNLIFAAIGLKPKIVFRDAINNDIRVVENAQYCIIYDRPLEVHGLTWDDLVDWWMALNGRQGDKAAAGRTLYRRLLKSVGSKPEFIVFKTYCSLYSSIGFGVPALIPQVYLHYDPYVRRDLMTDARYLTRQRMDFLLLMPNRQRIVIEVDGDQHYSADGKLSPKLYAEMVAEDRQLRLAGYEIYRFGGYELSDGQGEAVASTFFGKLLKRHGIAGVS
jgi:hypothetical protein